MGALRLPGQLQPATHAHPWSPPSSTHSSPTCTATVAEPSASLERKVWSTPANARSVAAAWCGAATAHSAAARAMAEHSRMVGRVREGVRGRGARRRGGVGEGGAHRVSPPLPSEAACAAMLGPLRAACVEGTGWRCGEGKRTRTAPAPVPSLPRRQRALVASRPIRYTNQFTCKVPGATVAHNNRCTAARPLSAHDSRVVAEMKQLARAACISLHRTTGSRWVPAPPHTAQQQQQQHPGHLSLPPRLGNPPATALRAPAPPSTPATRTRALGPRAPPPGRACGAPPFPLALNLQQPRPLCYVCRALASPGRPRSRFPPATWPIARPASRVICGRRRSRVQHHQHQVQQGRKKRAATSAVARRPQSHHPAPAPRCTRCEA